MPGGLACGLGLAQLDQHGGQGVRILGPIRGQTRRSPERGRRLFGLAHLIVGQAEVIGRSLERRVDRTSPLEPFDGIGNAIHFRKGQAQCVGHLRISRRESASDLQLVDRFAPIEGHLIRAARLLGLQRGVAQRDRQRVTLRRTGRLELDGLSKGVHGEIGTPAIAMKRAQHHGPGRLVRVLREVRLQIPTRSRFHGQLASQRPARLHAHRTDRIFQARNQRRPDALRDRLEGPNRFDSHQRVVVGKHRQQRSRHLRSMAPPSQHARDHGTPGVHLLGPRQIGQRTENRLVALPRSGQDPGPTARHAIHLFAVPPLRRLDRPVDRLVRMAAVAGVGNSVFAGEQRVRNRQPVIVPRIALHVDRYRHVTAHALPARLIRVVMGVRCRVELMRQLPLRIGLLAVAAQAQVVAFGRQPRGPLDVTVHALHALEVHP